jgi:hypothetical protein
VDDGATVIVTENVLLKGHAPLVENVTVYIFGILLLTSICPVALFKNTNPAGLAVKVPVAPPEIFAIGSNPVWQNAAGE